MDKSKIEYRNYVLREYFNGRNWDSNNEYALKRQLVLSSHQLLPNYPYVIEDEWEVEAGRTNKGRGDLVWVDAQAGQKTNQLFELGTTKAWEWAKHAEFIRWFSDGERRYGTALWKLASIRLAADEVHPNYQRRQVWRRGLEVAINIKSSQGRKRVEWVKVEHPFTAVSRTTDGHANPNEAHNSALRGRSSAYCRWQNRYAK